MTTPTVFYVHDSDLNGDDYKGCENWNACVSLTDYRVLQATLAEARMQVRRLAKEQLIRDHPLMRCGNASEFKQRLQWLSEGMLANHMNNVVAYKVDDAEIQAYRKYKSEVEDDHPN